nr:hypothetical protein [Clostridia bacterium]
DTALDIQAELKGLADGTAKLVAYQVDAQRNNCVTGAPCKALEATAEQALEVREGCASLAWTLPPYGFVQFHLTQA